MHACFRYWLLDPRELVFSVPLYESVVCWTRPSEQLSAIIRKKNLGEIYPMTLVLP